MAANIRPERLARFFAGQLNANVGRYAAIESRRGSRCWRVTFNYEGSSPTLT